jgi:hypothetical protein
MKGVMDEREPSIFENIDLGDMVGIAIALMFSVGAFYIIWRMLVGPSLFEPAIQAEIRAVEAQNPHPQGPLHTQPGEVSVGITPVKKP